MSSKHEKINEAVEAAEAIGFGSQFDDIAHCLLKAGEAIEDLGYRVDELERSMRAFAKASGVIDSE